MNILFRFLKKFKQRTPDSFFCYVSASLMHNMPCIWARNFILFITVHITVYLRRLHHTAGIVLTQNIYYNL